jgi:hypothetical protein
MKDLSSISTGQYIISKTLESIPETNKLAAKEIGQRAFLAFKV